MSDYRFLHQPQYVSSAYSQSASQKHYNMQSKRADIVCSSDPLQSYYTTQIPRVQHNTNNQLRKWGSISKIETVKSPLAFSGRNQARKVLRTQNFLQKQQRKKSTIFPQLEQLKKQVSKIIQYIPREQQISISSEKNLLQCESKQSLQDYFLKEKEDINPEQALFKTSLEKSIDSRKSSLFNFSTYDKVQYSQLKNSQLKTQLKNLKNKYRITKLDYEEKMEALERKNQYLQQTLKTAQEEIVIYKTELTEQMAEIRKKLKSQQSEPQQILSQPNQRIDDNECYKQRITSLYNQILQKNKRINEILIQLHDSKGQLQSKNYQLKTLQDKQKYQQLQLESIKKEIQRKQKYLQNQIQKNKDLTKKIDLLNLKQQPNVQITRTDSKQLSLFDAKTHQQLEAALKNQGNLLKMIRKLNLEIEKLQKKQKQYQSQVDTSKKQMEAKNKVISMLKQEYQNKETQINNLNKLLDEAIKNQEKNLLLKTKYEELQREFNQFKFNLQTMSPTTDKQQQEQPNKQLEQKLKLKDQQIQKWKIQYLIAKGKIEDRQKMEKLYKNRRIQTYYQQYMNFKSRNEIIEPKLAELQEQNKKFMEKMKTMEINQLNIRIKMKDDNNALSSALQRITDDLQSYKMREEQIIAKSEQADRALQQSNLYRRNIQDKILNSQTTDQQLKQAITIIKNRISDQDEKLAKQFREIKNKDSLIGKLRTEVQQLLTNKEADLKKIQIKDIRQRVSQILSEQIYFVEQIKSSANKECQILRSRNEQLIVENSQMKNKIYFIEQDNIKINYQKQKLAQMYNSKLQESQKQEADLNKIIQTVTKNYNEAYFEKNKIQNNCTAQLTNKDKKIQEMSNEIKKLSQYIDQRDLSGFSLQGEIKQYRETNQKLKKQLIFKDDQLGKLRDSYNVIKIAHENMKSQLEVQKLKAISERKNLQISLQIQIQNLKNQVTMNQKKTISLIQKVQVLAEQNKKKDAFIQSYIIGKKLPKQNEQFLTQFVKKYQTIFSKETIGSKLKEDLAEIEKVYQINFNLLKEISTLKSKISLYEGPGLQMFEIELNKTISTPYQTYRNVQAN